MRPYKFKPILKPTIWGGKRISLFKHALAPVDGIGESWELSGLPGWESRTVGRALKDDPDLGLTLPELIERHKGRLVGERVYAACGSAFPLLVKFIDSHHDLSLQVHPGDELARQRHGQAGKSEMWYIIHADAGSKIYAGLARPITPADFERLAYTPAEGHHSPIMDVVAAHEARAGDVFYLPAGCLHAIGAGCFLCEIQQSSDITYRVYDYDRCDANGHKRELHIEEAKEAIDYAAHAAYPVSYDTTKPVANLVQCPHFSVSRICVDGSATVDLHTDSFVIVVCTSGQMTINGIDVHQGETVLVPACDNILHIGGNATLLTATV